MSINLFNNIMPTKTYKYTSENLDKIFNRKKEPTCVVIDFSYIGKHKKLKRFVITSLAIFMIMEKRVLATPDLGELKPIYDSLLKYTNIVAYIAFLYKALETSIKGALEENLQSKWKQIIGYIIGFALFKYIPKIFDAIYVMK